MNIIKFKNSIFSKEDLDFCYKIDSKKATLGLLCTLYIILWRAQFTIRCKELGYKESFIQTFETARLQSKILTSNLPIRKFLAMIAFKNTLLLSGNEYINSVDKKDFVESSLRSILDQGDIKILAREQINSSEDINTTRRGVLARLKGNIQAVSMFNASSIISGKTPDTISFKEFIEVYISYVNYMFGINTSDLFKILQDSKYQYFPTSRYEVEILLDTSLVIEKISLEVKKFITRLLFDDMKIYVKDGIDFSEADNLLPLEKELPLSRILPRKLTNFDVEDDLNDPIIEEILKQQNEFIIEKKHIMKAKRLTKKMK